MLFLVAAILIYAIVFICLKFLGITKEIPNTINLLNWDASWYKSIIEEGYTLNNNTQSNTGFFPGFPYFWKIFNGNPLLVSGINLVLFLSGLFILVKLIKPNRLYVIFLITLPSLFFLFIPYSEALFYLFAVGFILSWKKNRTLLIVFFCIALSMVRPVFFFLVPALVAIVFFKQHKSTLKKISIASISLILGAAIGFSIIGYSNNDFFLYSKSQINNWNHSFQLTSFPLTTWRGYRILWLDGLALFFTTLSSILLFSNFIQKWMKNEKINFNSIEIISLGYLFMTLIYVLFFHPLEDGRTSILSLNRYVLVSPFFHFLLLKHIGKHEFNRKNISVLLLGAFITLVSLGFPYAHTVGLSYFHSLLFFIGLLFFFLINGMLFIKHKFHLIHLLLISCVHLVLLFYLFNSFLKGNWVG